MRRVLACVDFSPVSKRVVSFALDLAHSQEAELYLLHVAPPEPDFVGWAPGPDSVRDAVAKGMREAHAALQELARLAENGRKVTPLTIQGPTVEKILEQAAKLSVDVIVLASHGHGAVYELFVGSVTRGVLGGTSLPVIVVPDRR